MPTDKEIPLIPLETVEFVARKPWYFICPLIFVLCVNIAYISNLPDLYRSEAVVSFGVAGIESSPQRFVQRKQSLIARVLFANNVRKMIGQIWPEIKEETNPKRYENMIGRLQNPRDGINITFESLDPSMAHISFTSRVPDVSYNVVRSTINIIKSENSRIVEESVDASAKYLTSQLKIYKDKVSAIDSDIFAVSAKVKEMAAGLNGEQRDLVYKVMDEATMEQQYGDLAVTEEALRADDLAKINKELAEARRLKKVLEMRLEKKDFAPVIVKSQAIQEEVFTKAIEEKKLQMFDLVSKGYLSEHPDMRRLQAGIDVLENLREKQLRERFAVDARKLSSDEMKLAEMTLKSEIRNLDIAIEGLRNKKEAFEGYYKEAIESTQVAEDSLLGLAISEAKKLGSLKAEKSINERYYTDFRKQLEDVDLRGREEQESAGFVIAVVDEPKVPRVPIPKKKNNRFLMGLVMAVIAGLGFSYVADFLDKSVKSAAELRKKFGVPVIASIGSIYTSGDVTGMRIQRNAIAVSVLALTIGAMILISVAMNAAITI